MDCSDESHYGNHLNMQNEMTRSILRHLVRNPNPAGDTGLLNNIFDYTDPDDRSSGPDASKASIIDPFDPSEIDRFVRLL